MKKDIDSEEQVDDESRLGILSRVGAVAGAAKRQVSRSAEVMTGADIRRFEDFTEAATTAVVGVHRDQAELRKQLDQIRQSVNDVQAEVRERLSHIEQSVDDVQQAQTSLKEGLVRVGRFRSGRSPGPHHLVSVGHRIRGRVRSGAGVEHRRHRRRDAVMGYEQLKTLAESYPPQERESLLELAQRYRSRSEREVLELAALATDVSLDRVTNLPHEPDADPQFLEAFRLQYPNVSLEALRGASEERLEGLLKGAKGKYFRGAGTRPAQ